MLSWELGLLSAWPGKLVLEEADAPPPGELELHHRWVYKSEASAVLSSPIHSLQHCSDELPPAGLLDEMAQWLCCLSPILVPVSAA